MLQALKRRNLATFRNLAQQKLQQQVSQQASSQGPKAEFIRPTGFPLLVQGVRTNTKDPDSHVLFFDTESLIGECCWLKLSTMMLMYRDKPFCPRSVKFMDLH